MPADLATEILEEVYQNNKPLNRDLLARLAQVKKMRPVAIQRMPRTERYPEIINILKNPLSAAMAFQSISSWLITKQEPMLVDFLGHLGIPHDGHGCCDDFPENPPSRETLKSAVDFLLTKYPQPHVAVYLHAFNNMPDTCWDTLETLLADDARLKFSP